VIDIPEQYFQNRPQGQPQQITIPQSYDRIDSRDPGFLQWFLDSKEAIDNLKFIWRGYEENQLGLWEKTENSDENRIMNEKGIHWASSILRSYLNKNFQSTDWNEEHMNYEMRQAARTIWHTIQADFRNFGLSKINAANVGRSMLANIHSMLLSARSEGIRKFIGTTQNISEIRQYSPDERKSWFSGVSSIFGRRNQGGY